VIRGTRAPETEEGAVGGGRDGAIRTGGEGPGECGDPEVGGGAGRPEQPGGGGGHGHGPGRRRRTRRGVGCSAPLPLSLAEFRSARR
jgi:hypothetical protein